MARFKSEVHKPMQHGSKLSWKGVAQQENSENPSSQGVYVSINKLSRIFYFSLCTSNSMTVVVLAPLVF